MTGGTHHLALGYGTLADSLKLLGDLLKVEVIQVS